MELRSKRNRAGQALLAALFAALLTMCLELGLGYLKPGSISTVPAHLIHFGIMLALVSGLWLLCVHCPPFRKARAWLDERLMDGAKRKPAVEICYAVLAGLMLLHHFYVIIYYPVVTSGAVKLAPLWLLLAGLTMLMGKTWRDKGVLLASLSLIFAFERLFLKNLTLTGNDTVYFFTGIYAIFIAYSLFFVLRPAFRIPFLKVFCALWSLGTLAYCASGLYAAWTGITVYNLAGMDARVVYGGRLAIFSVATISAGIVVCGTAVSLMGFALVKNIFAKIGFLVVCFVSLVTLALTDSRSGFMMTAFMISGTICLGLWKLWKIRFLRIRNDKKRKWPEALLTLISLLVCFALFFLLAFEGQRQLTGVFVRLRDQKGIIPSALAEETAETAAEVTEVTEVTEAPPAEVTVAPPSIIQRDNKIRQDEDIDVVLSGRIEIWQGVLTYIQEHPETLLFGLSADGSAAVVMERPDHVHNMLLQTLLEGGIPGLALYLLVLIYFLFHACRLWKQTLPFGMWMLPLPVLSILLLDMAECLTHFSFGHPPVTILWFFMGCTVAVSKTIKKKEEDVERALDEESAWLEAANRGE